MTTTISNTTDLREEIAKLNLIAEATYFELAIRLHMVSEEKLYVGWGHESYADYVKEELSRSKTFASNMLKAGKWIVENNKDPKELPTSYSRLVQAIRLHPDNADLALAAATSLGEDDLVHQAKEARYLPHEGDFEMVCKICKTPQNIHAS